MFNMLFQQAVENPTSTEIQDVCAAVGFNVLLEVTKTRPPSLPPDRQSNQNHKKQTPWYVFVFCDLIFSYRQNKLKINFFVNSQDIFLL